MNSLFSIPTSTFLLLLGVVLPLPAGPQERFSTEDGRDEARAAYYRAIRKRGAFALVRWLLIGVAGLALVIHFIDGLGEPHDKAALALMIGLFGGLILAVQRSGRNRRVAVLFLAGFCGALIWQYAQSREYTGEAAWGIYLGLLLNYLFWFLWK